MSDIELTLTMLGEATAKELHKANNTIGGDNIKKDVKKAGIIAGNAREQIEKETGKSVVSSSNLLELNGNKIYK